jgi:hypothetical protein
VDLECEGFVFLPIQISEFHFLEGEETFHDVLPHRHNFRDTQQFERHILQRRERVESYEGYLKIVDNPTGRLLKS